MNIRFLLLTFLLLPVAHAASLDVQYKIGDLTEVKYVFSEVDEPFSVALPEGAGNETLNVTQNLTYTFLSGEYSDGAYFTTDLSMIPAEISEVRVFLPPAATLKQPLTQVHPSIHPLPTDSFSDGSSIIFLWEAEDLEPARAILLEYNPPRNNTIWWVLATVIVLATITYVGFSSFRGRKDYTRNLYRDEKRLVEILLDQDGKEMWQNSLTKESGLSKVKVSRKLKNLEKKGIIEKVPHGNTNKIRLLQDE